MALVRCSRGGKTRALEEIAHSLRRKRPEISVVFVSFNDDSVIKDWEHADPVAALCRRIAFAALDIAVPNKHDYDAFAETDATGSDILELAEQVFGLYDRARRDYASVAVDIFDVGARKRFDWPDFEC